MTRPLTILTLLLTLALFACSKQEEAPPPAKPEAPPAQETAAPPSQPEAPPTQEAAAPPEQPAPPPEVAKVTEGQEYLSPQEGKKLDMQSLEVVDKNISEAAKEPSAMSPPPEPGPETVVYEAKPGNVTFPHLDHSQRLPCTACHGEGMPTKIVLDKDKAHQLCKGCHQEKKAGPTACSGCHKKS